MRRHTVMSEFPEFLKERVGHSHVWVLTSQQDLRDNSRDFYTQQQNYFWRDADNVSHGYFGEPNAHLNHHTASSGYTPNVRNSSGKTKANAYLGALRDGRLYQFADSSGREGVPVVALAAAGPANYSAGSGNKEFLTFAVNDRRFHGPQRNADEYPKWYGNRFYWNTEVIARGDGSPLLPDVWDLLVEYNRALKDFLNWSPWRLGVHYDHTRRKIDLKVEQGNPYSVGLLQDIINMSDAPVPEPPVDPPESPEGEWRMEVKYGDGFDSRSPERQPSVAAFQGALKLRNFKDDNSQAKDGVDGKFGRGTERACKAYQLSVGLPVTGIADMKTRSQCETWS